MNTIPLIFNERPVNITVLDGKPNAAPLFPDVTCLLINRSSSRYRHIVLENLIAKRFKEVISIEKKSEGTTVETLSRKYPDVKFIVAFDELTIGEMINIGFAQAKTQYVLVISDELAISPVQLSPNQVSKFISQEQFCIVPRLATKNLTYIPVRFIPYVDNGMLSVESSLSVSQNIPTLYSYDWTGFYNRDKFIQSGGADYTITNEYYQKLDLFFRSWLWGEKTSICTTFVLNYSDEVYREDTTVDLSYFNFYLKNLLPVYFNDHCYIPTSSFFSFKHRSRLGISKAVEQFKDAKSWCEKNKYRFKMDASSLISNWGVQNETI